MASCHPAERRPPLLELRNVTVAIDGAVLLDEVSLEIAQGESAVILGPNGAGKTTLLRLITRERYPLRHPRTSLRIFGRDRWNVFELRRRLGVVSHELQVRHQRALRGIEVVQSGFFASVGIYRHHRLGAEETSRSQAILERLAIADLGGRRFDTLSAGEQRRFLLARALVHDPPTLLLDEPTTSLDLGARVELLRVLRLLAAEKTLLLVTHQLREIPPEANRVILLRRGRVAFDGPKSEALTSERLSELFQARLEVHERDGIYSAVPAAEK